MILSLDSEEGRVSFNLLILSFIMLLDGSFSEKFEFIFKLFGSGTELDVEVLNFLIFTPMIPFLAVKRDVQGMFQVYNAVITYYSPKITPFIVKSEEDSSVLYINFLDWFTNEGTKEVPWLDFISLPHPIEDIMKYLKIESDYPLDLFLFKNARLKFTKEDVDRFLSFNFCTFTQSCEVRVIYEEICNISSNGLIVRDDFVRLIVSKYIAYDHYILLQYFETIFDSFVIGNEAVIPNYKLFTSISIFFHGSSQDKLFYAFNAFCQTNDQKLTMTDLSEMIYCYLIPLARFSTPLMTLSETFTYCLQESSKFVVDKLFKYYDYPETIEFDKFMEWFQVCGYHFAGWIYYLDISNWKDYEIYKSKMSLANNEANNNDSSQQGDELYYQLLLSSDSTVLPLNIRESSILFLESIMETANLQTNTFLSIVNRILEYSENDTLDFDGYISSVIPLTYEDYFVQNILDNLFIYLESEEKNSVQTIEFISSLCPLFNGTKSEKLEIFFNTFSKTNDGKISSIDLSTILESILFTIYLISYSWDNLTPESCSKVKMSSKIVVNENLREFINDLNLQETETFDLATFANWYNAKGNENMQWLELINFTHWPPINMGNDILYSVQLYPESIYLTISNENVGFLKKMIENTPFKTIDDLDYLLKKEYVTREEFTKLCLNNPVVMSFYDYLDIKKTLLVPSRDLYVSFLLFVYFSKTEKLTSALNLFTLEGVISEASLTHFLFLVLWSINYFQQYPCNDKLISNHIADSLFTFFNGKNGYTFDDFAYWYNNNGYKYISWLEFLDIRKWAKINKQAVFNFILNKSQDKLDFYEDDIKQYFMILEETAFDSVKLEKLYENLVNLCGRSGVKYEEFSLIIQSIFPKLPSGDKIQCINRYFLELFKRLRYRSEKVALNELFVVLSLFCIGDKSKKLQQSFSLLSDEGKMNKTQAKIFFRCLMISIVQLSLTISSYPSVRFENLVEKTVNENICSLFNDKDEIFFEDFADWYIRMGSETMSWIELLSQPKWKVESFQDKREEEIEEEESKEIEAVIRSKDESKEIIITKKDWTNFLSFIKDSEQDKVDIELLEKLIKYISKNNNQTFEFYESFLNKVFNKEFTLKHRSIFIKVFEILKLEDELSNQSVFTSIIYFTSLDPQKKVSTAIQSYMGQGYCPLGMVELGKCMVSLFSPLLAVAENKMAIENVHKVFESLYNLIDDYEQPSTYKIDSDDFENWYEAVGHKSAPWIELLNFQKLSRKMEESGNKIIVSCGCGGNFELTPESTQIMDRYREETKIDQYTPNEVINVFMDVTKNMKSHLTFNEHWEMMKEVYQRFNDNYIVQMEDYINKLYKLFEYNLSIVPIRLICISLLFLSKGKKSNKLSAAFQLCGSKNTEKTRSEFRDYLYSLLISIVSFINPNTSEDASEFLYRECTSVAENVINEGETISFADFAAWYSDVGSDIIPWIELLDFSKWPREL